MSEIAQAVNTIEMAVLRAIARGNWYLPAGECFWNFRPLMEETGLSRDYVRAACRSLTDKGLAEYSHMLWDDDGCPAGSGYAATKAGVQLADGTGTERESAALCIKRTKLPRPPCSLGG